jgi:hypothetical protein
MSMRSQKRVIRSAVLGRFAHADFFDVGAEPKLLFVLFGGSGVDQEEYERRRHSIIPVFGRTLEAVDRRAVNLTMVYVTAPYDVPLNRFATNPALAEAWNAHVTTELLEPWSHLPYFVSSFSGGAALALNGVHEQSRCFGGAALGADAIPPHFTCPPHWMTKLHVYEAPGDRVCNHPANQHVVGSLIARGQAERHRLAAGEHSLTTYSIPECLGELICLASDMAATRGS